MSLKSALSSPLAPRANITFSDFSNATLRHSHCSGEEGTCATRFCDGLFDNATALKNEFCTGVDLFYAQSLRCARSYSDNLETKPVGDPT